jgi:hypothetical protein
MTEHRTPYQILKNESFSFLNEDTDSLFYYLTQKKLNLRENCKKVVMKILRELEEKVSFFDIVRHLISKNDVNTLTEMILGERVSSSKKAIFSGYDCCLCCKKDTACQKTLSSLEYKDKVNYLLYLRYVKAKKVLKMLKWGYSASCFNVLLREPVLMKFLANYALVVDIKNEMKKEGVITAHKTLYKGAGKYCPFNDLWEAERLHLDASPN